jgi:patatin-related protein
MDRFMVGKSIDWPRRASFIERNFESYRRLNIDPTAAYFIDGSVLNNRPFHQAISAIRGRPAYRQVDRRVVYIDPDPALPGSPVRRASPSFFAVLKSALSDLPSIEPVTGELDWVDDFNDRVDRLREIIDDARPRVRRLVANIVTASLDQRLPPEQIRIWREQANIRAAHDAGFAYEGYVRLKLASVRAFLSSLITKLRGSLPRSPEARAIAEVVNAWATTTGRVYDIGGEQSAHLETPEAGQYSPKWVEFLLTFDVDYRKRRLHFMIEGQNRLYQILDEGHFEAFHPAVVDRLKRTFYDCLDALNRREAVHVTDPTLCELVCNLFPATLSPDDAQDLQRYARRFVTRHRESLDILMRRLAAAINLEASTNDVELLLADTDPAQWHAETRRDVLVNYLGFPFWDVLTFPVMRWREVGEFNRILIDRISPEDARTLAGFNGAASLRGTAFSHFAAFFSRAYRENDYLLGRLHALDRLIDIVCDSAALDLPDQKASILAWKKKGLMSVLDAEEKHLPRITARIAILRKCIEELGSDSNG